MKIQKLAEHGYEEAVLGFSLSYNTSIVRTKQILPKYAFGVPGESKFLESIMLWWDVTAPRYWWQEADTYRVGVTKQSESTMHTLTKRGIGEEDFERYVDGGLIKEVNYLIGLYRQETDKENKAKLFLDIKSSLPEGYLQRRIWMFSYKTLQNIYVQRYNHRLPQWRTFLDYALENIEHPEFIIRRETSE
jgi:hypothetical protein